MAEEDPLASFYAEIATVEAAAAEPEPEGAAPPAAAPAAAPAAPPPLAPPLAPPPLPPPPRPPPGAVTSRVAFIAAPPRAASPPAPAPPAPPPPDAPPPPPAGPAPRPMARPGAPGGAPHGAATAAAAAGSSSSAAPGARLGLVRTAAGERWLDAKLAEWPAGDYRIFVGNLGPEVTDAALDAAFRGYPTYNCSRVVRDGHTGKSRGYGFVSIQDPVEGARALREMHAAYVGSRPVQLKRSAEAARAVTDRKGRARTREVADRPAKASKRPFGGGGPGGGPGGGGGHYGGGGGGGRGGGGAPRY
jgi:hypothetical protein